MIDLSIPVSPEPAPALQDGLQTLETLLIGAENGVQMDALGERRERTGIGAAHAGDELLHIIAAGELQAGSDLAIDGVLHRDIHGSAAAVHNGVELFRSPQWR